MKALSKALRDVAALFSDHACTDERARQDAAELICVLARIVDGKPLERAFGAPGDWGYNHPIGAALYAFLQEAPPAHPLPAEAAEVLRTLLAYHANAAALVREGAKLQQARPGEGLNAVADRHEAFANTLLAIGVPMPTKSVESLLSAAAPAPAAPETGGAA